MQITEVKVFPVSDKKLRAFVSIVFDSSFMVNDIKVIQGNDGLFISMPSRRRKNGRFKDIAHPLNQETRQVLEERIISEYERVVESGGQERSEDRPAVPPRPQPEAAAPRRPESEVSPQPEAEVAPAGGDTGTRQEPADDGQGDSFTADDKSLEEVAEAHLSDSYWTT